MRIVGIVVTALAVPLWLLFAFVSLYADSGAPDHPNVTAGTLCGVAIIALIVFIVSAVSRATPTLSLIIGGIGVIAGAAVALSQVVNTTLDAAAATRLADRRTAIGAAVTIVGLALSLVGARVARGGARP